MSKLYNKITLREQPDLSPVADASFKKGHSFIFPGDEIVMCTKINAPVDIGGSWSQIKFQAVKVSIIAKKPNIFSEEFSIEFASTRSFELDSFIVALNNVNCPSIAWGTAGYAPNLNLTQDRNWSLPSGDFKRQINFFTGFTPGGGGSAPKWDYNFWFPFIFDERYWIALAAADNDFYNVTQPQNGKNDKWLRYHNLAALPFGWLIYAKFELQYTKGTTPKTLTSEYCLSNEQTGIQDYNSNTDFNNRSIKTCAVGGTPSSSCFIFGYQNTSCFGYMSKLTAWDAGEKANLNAVFRIRPFEGGDRLGSAGSSKFPPTSDVVWTDLTTPINTDAALDLDCDDADTLLIDNSGASVVIDFDPLDDKNVIIEGEIDYQKLALIFPNVIKFTIYCRLYNGTILLGETKTTLGNPNVTGNQFVDISTHESYVVNGIGAGFTLASSELPDGWTIFSTSAIVAGVQTFVFNTGIGSGTVILTYQNGTNLKYIYLDVYCDADRMGEEIKHDGALLVPNPPPRPKVNNCDDPGECPAQQFDCPFVLDVFADANDPTNDLHNDKSDFYGEQYMGDPSVANITLTLQKNNDACGGCNWTDKYTFVEGVVGENKITCPYGSFFGFGHSPNFTTTNLVDAYGNKYTGLLLFWIKILQAFGEGQYRMKITYTSAIDGSVTTDYDIRIFCLHQWNCFNIDGTVRIETTNSGFRGTMNNNKLQIDYFSGWYGQVRLKGIFYETKPAYNKEFNQYGDAEYNAFRPVIHELAPKFNLDVKPAPGWIDWLLENYILLSDQMLMTDYNISNRKKFLQTPVMNEGGIDTKDDAFVNPLAWSRVSLTYGQNNLRRRND